VTVDHLGSMITSKLPALAAMAAIEDRAAEGGRCGGENLMPQILHAVESYATVGEIANACRARQLVCCFRRTCRLRE
jgi:methylmalonyl-CoA mutase N-terminal domain/subunit